MELNNKKEMENYFIYNLKFEKNNDEFTMIDKFKKNKFLNETKISLFLNKINIKWFHFFIFTWLMMLYFAFSPLFLDYNIKELIITWIVLSTIFSLLYIIFIILGFWKWKYFSSTKRINKLKIYLESVNDLIYLINKFPEDNLNFEIHSIKIVSKSEIEKIFNQQINLTDQYFLQITMQNDQIYYWNYFSKNQNDLIFYLPDDKQITLKKNQIVSFYLNKPIDIFNYELICKIYPFYEIAHLFIKLFCEKILDLNYQLTNFN
ncbi:hypothetical protein [Mesomycoplasma lagogenitalium]|uniref:DUF3137 domain-containing protein n=1 Tax=Mesomycoplasma lagogenitalium TaxID=171286 RepID=A0ABY8LSN6_9BACT|nr:hypothetical protein [Mesomycoplasma lagogenitalium]WGI36269.1 hypothetical protein QEG99_02200 [Mesomycoplasma lagogenitalium]